MKTVVEMENSGLLALLRDDKSEDLQRMYHLLRRVEGGLALMRTMIADHIKETGKQLVQVSVSLFSWYPMHLMRTMIVNHFKETCKRLVQVSSVFYRASHATPCASCAPSTSCSHMHPMHPATSHAQDPERCKDPVEFVQQLLERRDKYEHVGRQVLYFKGKVRVPMLPMVCLVHVLGGLACAWAMVGAISSCAVVACQGSSPALVYHTGPRDVYRAAVWGRPSEAKNES